MENHNVEWESDLKMNMLIATLNYKMVRYMKDICHTDPYSMMPFAGVTTLRHVCTLGRTMDFPPWLLTDHLQSEYESKMSRISRCACQGFPNSLSFQLPIPKKLELAGSVPEFSHVFPRKTQPN